MLWVLSIREMEGGDQEEGSEKEKVIALSVSLWNEYNPLRHKVGRQLVTFQEDP